MVQQNQISNEQLLALTRKAFAEDNVVDLLQGTNGYACPIDRFTPANIPTDFGRVLDQGIYRFYNENHEKTMIDNFKEAICKLCEGSPAQIWIAFMYYWHQLRNEAKGKSAFILNDINLSVCVKEAIKKHENELRICKDWQGWNEENGLWQEIQRINNIARNNYGVEIL
jgi:hypothetical protein